MVVVNPQDSVLAFQETGWLFERLPLPKEETKNALSEKYDELYEELSKNLKGEEEVDADKADALHDALMATEYDHFSLAADGSLLLVQEGYNASAMLLTGADAEALLPVLEDVLKARVEAVNGFLRR